MTDVKYDTNTISKKNIITAVISLIVTYIICGNRSKKKKKKFFGTFSKLYNFISQLWTSLVLKKKTDKEKDDIFPVKIEKAKIIHL